MRKAKKPGDFLMNCLFFRWKPTIIKVYLYINYRDEGLYYLFSIC